MKPIVKTERLSPCEQKHTVSDENCIRVLSGLHLTFNLEAGSLLPLAIKLVIIEAEFSRAPRQRRPMNNVIIIVAEAV